MRKTKNATSIIMVGTFLAVAAVPALADDCAEPTNRYCLPHNYHSEISAAEAYLKAVDDNGWDHGHNQGAMHGKPQPVIIDVRSIPEYVAGHPEGATNIPYPFIYQPCSERSPDGACIGGGDRVPQADGDFVAAVEQAFPNKDTPIFTLCRTGHRSVLAANLLTAAGYSHVRNIWQGFVGRTKVDVNLNGPLDLNHDGQITDQDNDGWRYYQGLPYSTKLLPQLIYQPYAYYYYE